MNSTYYEPNIFDDFSTSDVCTPTEEPKTKAEPLDREKQMIHDAKWYIEGLQKRLTLHTIRLIVELKQSKLRESRDD